MAAVTPTDLRMGASNCQGHIGSSAIGDGGKDNSGDNNPALSSGVVNYNNNKNNSYTVRPCSSVLVPATSQAVYGIPFTSIVEAWLDCESKKRSAMSCVKFRWHAQRDLVELWRQMDEGRYTPRSSMVFIVTHPVKREVWAGAFRDRVAHHWEALRFQRHTEEYIVESGDLSMNCRKGYGNLVAIDVFERMLRDYTEGYTRRDCYIVGGDFANFFMSIDKDLLWDMLYTLLNDRYEGDDKGALLYMMHRTLFHKCRDDYYRRSPVSMWDGLPHRKSLFHMDGLPIGNLPSQLWANFLGAAFMDWMVRVKGYRNFILFVDDWRVLVRSAEEGRRLLREAREWLWDNLRITLHPDKVYLQHYTKGTQVVGAVIKPGRREIFVDAWLDKVTHKALHPDWDGDITPRHRDTDGRSYISNRTRGHFISTMMKLNAQALASDEKGRIAMLAHVRASINSYLGMMIHHKSYRVRRKIILKYIMPVWGKYMYFEGDLAKAIIRKEYDPVRNLRRKLRSSKFARNFIRPIYEG